MCVHGQYMANAIGQLTAGVGPPQKIIRCLNGRETRIV